MELNDFLNPKSMFTPAIAGGIIMSITNTLWIEFAIPQKWSALSLSFLILLPVIKGFSANLLEKFIYFILNWLMLFAIAVGTNTIGIKIVNQQTHSDVSIHSTSKHPNYTTNSYHVGDKKHSDSANAPQRKFFESWSIF